MPTHVCVQAAKDQCDRAVADRRTAEDKAIKAIQQADELTAALEERTRQRDSAQSELAAARTEIEDMRRTLAQMEAELTILSEFKEVWAVHRTIVMAACIVCLYEHVREHVILYFLMPTSPGIWEFAVQNKDQ